MLPTRSFSALLLLKLWWPLRGAGRREEGRQAVSGQRRGVCTRGGGRARANVRRGPPHAHQSCPTTKSAQNMVPCANQ